MNILITCPRAPAVLDWIAVFSGSLKNAGQIVLCDSLRFPLAAFAALSLRPAGHDSGVMGALALLALKHPGLQIADTEVVAKSFPSYWKQLDPVLQLR